MDRSLRRVAQRAALDALMMMGGNANVTPEVRAVVLDRLDKFRAELGSRHDEDAVTEAHYRQAFALMRAAWGEEDPRSQESQLTLKAFLDDHGR